MRGGRFKVSRLCSGWCEEYRMYHYEKGQVVKEHDDLMSATRIGWMDRRYAKAIKLGPAVPQRPNPPAGSLQRLAIGSEWRDTGKPPWGY